MKSLLLLLSIAMAACNSLNASPQGTAFTYQGRLTDGGAPANGLYDLRFSLFDCATNGNPIGPVLTNLSVAVTNGMFCQSLDFGPGVFTGNAVWLCVAVSPHSSQSGFTALSPLQPITPAPGALYAPGAGSSMISISEGGTGGNTPAAAFSNLTPSLYDAESDDPNLDGTWALGAGQILVTHDGFMYYATGEGPWVWNSLYNFQGGVTTLGSPSRMSPISLGPSLFYTMGNPSYQTAAFKNYDAQVVQINCNPYTSGSGWDCALVGTNYSPSYLPISTNANGEVIYMIDRVALSLVMAPMQSIPADLPGFGQVVMNGAEQFALDSALVIDGISGNYSYFQTDPANERLHFMKWTGGVFTNGDPASVDVMTVDYKQGQVSILNLSAKAVNVNGATWFSGTGSPEGSVSAGIGSLYTRTDGGPGSTLYVKESGNGNTGWTAK